MLSAFYVGHGQSRENAGLRKAAGTVSVRAAGRENGREVQHLQGDVFEMYLEEIKAVRDCDRAENERLLKELRGGGKAARDRLIEGNLRTVLEMVQEYLNRGVPAGDLVQEANMALVLAAAEYEEGSFEDFLRERVRKALLAAVEEQSREQKAAEKMLDRVNKLKDVSRDMAGELGREASVEELAERMKLTADEVREAMKLALDAMSAVAD